MTAQSLSLISGAARAAHRGLQLEALTQRILVRSERLVRMVESGVPSFLVAQGCDLLAAAVDELERQALATMTAEDTDRREFLDLIARARPSQFDPVTVDRLAVDVSTPTVTETEAGRTPRLGGGLA